MQTHLRIGETLSITDYRGNELVSLKLIGTGGDTVKLDIDTKPSTVVELVEPDDDDDDIDQPDLGNPVGQGPHFIIDRLFSRN